MFKIFRRLQFRDYLFLVLVAGLIVGSVFLDLKAPDYTAELSKAVALSEESMEAVLRNGGSMLLCCFGSAACQVLSGLLCAIVANRIAYRLRKALFDKITSFSNEEMERFSIASLITRTSNDVMRIQFFFSMSIQTMIKAPVMAIWALTKISFTSVAWTQAVGITVAIIVVLMVILLALIIPKLRRIQGLIDNLNEVTRENITGVRVVRAFNAEGYQEAKFNKASLELAKNQLFTSRVAAFFSPFVSFAMNALTIVIYWIAAVLIQSQVDLAAKADLLASMTVFTQYAIQVIMAFIMMVAIFVNLPRSIVAAKRINEVLDSDPSIKDGEVEFFLGKGKIEFDNVSFAYPGADKPVLSDISFVANPGETVSFIGSTGSGKTTLVNLLNRFYDVSGGSIKVDGVDIRDYRLAALEQKISLAPQKASLFSGTIKSNVSYSDLQPDEAKVESSLRLAGAEFALEEEGMEKEVSQGGSNYSGGQKQRLSIARALYKDSEIMVFDDTFSALDYKTDAQVRSNIKRSFADRTVLIVAQRIGTIRDSDKIVVLDEGRIVGIGKHDELLATCPTYKEIALSQLNEEEL